ncbi:hypothetical protein ACWASM_004954 [Enterobacter cloacae]|uniref:hypothetical protein n=1 Tax=Enterobacter TaxID=547 RepID=UPI0005896D8C|nr:hypothetical protein [Enterobacter cloacae]EGQ7342274.1 hypothetical protein [Enterobacter cloacae]KIF93662.1 hypothetical protein SD66_23100 [Enterobacter cloacae]MBY5118074.1 hypothetical protein [Enterobacter cloacae]MCK1077732.1 hypothetical protein [Enterobacter cloacae subsp. cloacae]MCL8316658.1 hypothetical protein [Enterobacter cloacae subsp. cloacae]
MASRDDELYSEIGRILFESAPEDAQKLFLDAELSPENDHAKFLYDYINKQGEKTWFLPGTSATDSLLLKKLVELRNFYIEQGLTGGRPVWHGCLVTVDLEKMKINLDYRYD